MSAQTTTQKALLYTSKENGKFVLGTIGIPKVVPGHLLVKIHATALNPADWKAPKRQARLQEFPAVLGLDAAGEVAEIGDGVTGFELGDRVFFQGGFKNSDDTFQQYAVTAANTVARIPKNISYDEAATVALAFGTAWIGFFHRVPLGFGLVAPTEPSTQGKYAGAPVVIFGGASSVGQYAIQIAKLAGFSTIITTASVKHAEYLKSLGATHVIDRNATSAALISEVKRITSAPIQYVYDAISEEETQRTGYEVLAPGGFLAIVLPSQIKEVTEGKEVHHTSVHLHSPDNAEILQKMHSTLPRLLEEGLVKGSNIYPLCVTDADDYFSQTGWKFSQADSEELLEGWRGWKRAKFRVLSLLSTLRKPPDFERMSM